MVAVRGLVHRRLSPGESADQLLYLGEWHAINGCVVADPPPTPSIRMDLVSPASSSKSERHSSLESC
jgi:hypothetical protein